jgi:hypothetical protein
MGEPIAILRLFNNVLQRSITTERSPKMIDPNEIEETVPSSNPDLHRLLGIWLK